MLADADELEEIDGEGEVVVVSRGNVEEDGVGLGKSDGEGLEDDAAEGVRGCALSPVALQAEGGTQGMLFEAPPGQYEPRRQSVPLRDVPPAGQ
jgi:hypothetical protein